MYNICSRSLEKRNTWQAQRPCDSGRQGIPISGALMIKSEHLLKSGHYWQTEWYRGISVSNP